MSSFLKQFFTLVLLGVILFALNLFAFTEPTQAPPGGNVAAPVNTGGTAQTKSGGLNILGSVGIGTTAPGGKLDIFNSAVADTWAIIRSGSGAGLLIGACNNGTESCLHQTSATNWTFRRQDGAVQMAINNNGNVGIGTPGPSQKLDVAGYITAHLYLDRDNTGYYLDPNGTSRLNYGVWDNMETYGYIYARGTVYSNGVPVCQQNGTNCPALGGGGAVVYQCPMIIAPFYNGGCIGELNTLGYCHRCTNGDRGYCGIIEGCGYVGRLSP